MPKEQKVLVIIGPTASGKSALAVELSKKLIGEVISADSRQVYTGLDIGTGKVTKKEMKGVRHHLLDVASAKKSFTANDFIRLGEKAIDDIARRGKLPIVCGGTGFYIDALLGQIELSDVEPNLALRKKLKNKKAEELLKMLQKRDKKRAAAMNESDRHNPVRLIRALEIASHKKTAPRPVAKRKYDALWIGIAPDAKTLRDKIHKRLLARMKTGMVKEAQKLHKAGLAWKRMEELGLEYRYLALYLQKKISKEEMLQQLEHRIWQYSKRQMTYWRRNKDIQWFKDAGEAFLTLVAK